MICYKDMTFCPFWRRCRDGTKCDRACTKTVETSAYRSGLQVARFLDKPTCFVYAKRTRAKK